MLESARANEGAVQCLSDDYLYCKSIEYSIYLINILVMRGAELL
jgi:hypothetical protein